jgi:hypothetical protein
LIAFHTHAFFNETATDHATQEATRHLNPLAWSNFVYSATRRDYLPAGFSASMPELAMRIHAFVGGRLQRRACHLPSLLAGLLVSIAAAGPASAASAGISADFSGYKPASGVAIHQNGTLLELRWPIAKGEHGRLVLQLQPKQPLIEEMGISQTATGKAVPLLQKVNPVTLLTVGIRDLSKQGWNAFFDNPPLRPHQTYAAALEMKSVRIQSQGRRSTVIIDGLSAGPFRGDLRFTVYPGCRLVHTEAVVSTEKDACAILYNAGLTSPKPAWKTIAWIDTTDKLRQAPATSQDPATPIAARYRTIIAEGDGGSVAVFPPPHQYLYPLDFADNFKLVWHGRGFQKQDWGFGIRQPPEGDKRFVPWVNAPPRTQQHLGVFYLLSAGKAAQALDEARRFTHGDRFKKLNGHLAFTSHYHIEHTLDFLRRQKDQKTAEVPRGLEVPPFVKTFKAHGVDIVHLAEFHIAHTPEINARRLPLLRTLHGECRRLSDDQLLVLPGEEPNVHLGGHWISLFPRPVYWLLHPREGAPFQQEVKGYGTVYAVRDSADVLRLMEKEKGLMWTAHPRTKSSYGFPDRYRLKDFYLSDHFLGAAWKAMPANLAHPRLGARVLDLMDDMANWGQHKYVLGEVDVFKVQPDYELYGHMNINYLKLDRLPRFDDGWQSVLDALRRGRFFVSTGEVLVTDFKVGGKESGQTLRLTGNTVTPVEARLEWTFPPAFAEIIFGDGSQVRRHRVDLSDQEAFSSKTLRVRLHLRGVKWLRLEAWDIAANGAFTQPAWIE